MTRIFILIITALFAALAFLLASTAHAGDSVGGLLWPPEPQHEIYVEEVTCMQLKDCCDVHGPCWNWYDKPIPVTSTPVAPVPLPPAGLLFTAALAALALKRKRT